MSYFRKIQQSIVTMCRNGIKVVHGLVRTINSEINGTSIGTLTHFVATLDFSHSEFTCP